MDGTEEQNPDAVDDAAYPHPAESESGSLSKIILYGIGSAVLLLMMATNLLSVADTEEIVGIVLIAAGFFELGIALIRYRELKYFLDKSDQIIDARIDAAKKW